MTQRDRVLRALRQRGAHGVTQVDFMPPTIDGGSPVLRLAARVQDLRDAGERIDTVGNRDGVAVYVLSSSAGVVEGGRSPSGPPCAPSGPGAEGMGGPTPRDRPPSSAPEDDDAPAFIEGQTALFDAPPEPMSRSPYDEADA